MPELPTITTLPPAPARTQDSDTFNTNAAAFLAALATLVTDVNAFGAALAAYIDPAGFVSTSTTSRAIGTGSKSFTVQNGRLYFVGQPIGIFSSASPSNYMIGRVTSYDSATGALVVEVAYTSGSGTLASWNVGPLPAPATNFNPRVVTDGATTGTLTPTSDTADMYIMSGLTGPVTIGAPSGTPVDGQKLMLRIKDNGVTKALTWNAAFRAAGSVNLATATTPSKWHYYGFVWNAADSKWDALAGGVIQ
jgi:hypothetical protein